MTAEPNEIITDINRTALLGGEPAERVCGVNEGDEMECDGQSRLQQAPFYCKESRQRNGNANGNVPSAYKLLLEGEWTVYASSEASNLNGDANASNAAVEHVVSPSELRVTEDTPGVESEGCKGGTSGRESIDEPIVKCCQQLCMADSNPGHGVEPMDSPIESEVLEVVSIEPIVENGEADARVCLGGTRWRTDDTNSPGRETDGSRGQADVLRGWTDTLNMSNSAGTAGMSDSEGAWTYLGVRDAKRVVHEMNGVGSHADVSTGPTDVPSVNTDTVTTANMTETVSTPRK